MKKKNLKSLRLSKKSISNLSYTKLGGAGEDSVLHQRSGCPDLEACKIVVPPYSERCATIWSCPGNCWSWWSCPE